MLVKQKKKYETKSQTVQYDQDKLTKFSDKYFVQQSKRGKFIYLFDRNFVFDVYVPTTKNINPFSLEQNFFDMRFTEMIHVF